MREKLRPAWSYIRSHPRGEYRGEVETWFFPNEERLYAEMGRTPAGAAAYLEILPDGPHAKETKTFLDDYEREERERPLRREYILEAARKKARAQRHALGDSVESWTRRALAIESFRQERKVLEASTFGAAYFNDPPAPICDDDGCSKYFTFVYAVPDQTTAIDRTVVLEVRVETTAGLVTAITLVLPKRGFTYWLEGSEERAVSANNPDDRTESIVRARNRIESIVREVRGGGCNTDEEEVTRRVTCGSVRVAVSTTPSGDDTVRIIDLGP
jgi:hypothetical protein